MGYKNSLLAIVKIQAVYRGYLVHKKYKMTRQRDSQLEYKDNYQFPNGAIYTGIYCEVY